MSGRDDWDGLLDEARQALREQEENPNSDLGDEMTPASGDALMGRWRGDGQMQTKRGLVDVYLVWDRDGDPGFLYQHTRLVQEVDAEQPQVGDQVLILRGEAETYEQNGEEREVYPYVLRKRPCSDPLPGQPELEQKATQQSADDEFPY
jgi:hypothetical protein